MKRIYFLLLALVILTSAEAGPVTLNQAKEKARVFALKKGLPQNRELKMVNLNKKKAKSVAQSEISDYYIFNRGDKQGFVIVGGDESAPDILGYSDTGAIDPETMPENMKNWLQSYSDQIQYLAKHPSMRIKRNTNKNVEVAREPVEQLCTSEWHQIQPYNQTAQHFTGCVPTAMAQLLYYYRKTTVKKTLKDIPGYTTRYTEEEIPTIPAGTVLDWDNMLDHYSSKGDDATEVQKKAVADLMYYCGVACEAEYGYPNETPAYDGMISSSLKEYFGFDEKGVYVSKDNYEIDEWDRLLYNELSHSRPVIYGGSSTSGGHSFIIDGFDGESLYHVNWGWGGGGNGYYRLSVLEANDHDGDEGHSISSGFVSGQKALLYAAPVVEDEPLIFEENGVDAEFGEVTGNKFYCRFTNRTGSKQSFYFGFAYKTADDRVVPFYWRPYSSIVSHNSMNGFTVEMRDSYFKGLEPRTYQIIPIYKIEGSDEWMECNHSDQVYGLLVWDGQTVKSVDYHNEEVVKPELTIREVNFSGSGIVKKNQSLDLVVDCSNADFKGVLYMFMSTTEEMGTSPRKACTIIHKGDSQGVRFKYYPQEAGTYNFWITTDNAGTEVIGKYVHEITENPESTDLQITSVEVDNLDSTTLNSTVKTLYGSSIKVNLTVKNPTNYPFSGVLYFYFRSSGYENGSYNVSKYEAGEVTIPAGETKELSYIYEGALVNRYYQFDMMNLSDSKHYTHNKFKTYKLCKGIVLYKSDGTKTARAVPSNNAYRMEDDEVVGDFTSSGIANVTPNSNPNTIYMFGENDEVPSSLKGHNVIKGSVAEKMSINASYKFYVPREFTAKEMSYSYVPAKYNNGQGGWEAFVMPFDVTDVDANGKKITWYHDSKDNDKDFWMMKFSDQDYNNGKVYFDYADQIKAHIPFIVAIPGPHSGEQSDLTGKTITFHGKNAVYDTSRKLVSSSSVYSFKGTYVNKDVEGEAIYYMNPKGTAFEKATGVLKVPAFHAYFEKRFKDDETAPSQIPINFHDELSSILGDLNGDGIISVSDVTLLVDYILGHNVEIVGNADINGDGIITVSDVTELVSIILGKTNK